MVLRGIIKQKFHILLLLLPLIAIGIFCLRYRQNVFNYYLPNSQWNDEVIYYKTIEGIKEYGIPQGYFGYNESHAQIGTLGAWSPVAYILDVMWCRTLGWNFFSPIFARILFSIFSFAVYSKLCRPNIKKTTGIIIYVVGFTLYSRYLVSQMLDSYIVSMLVIFAGLYEKRKIIRIKTGLIVLIVLLTLIRPYFTLLWLLMFEAKTEDNGRGILEIVLAIGSLLGYFIITKYFTASYFIRMIDFGWLEMIIDSPMEGIKNLFNIIWNALIFTNEKIILSVTNGSDVGSQYFLFYLLTMFFLIGCVIDRQDRIEFVKWLIINIIFWFAIVLLYDVRVGSRHLMPFIVVEGVFIIGQYSWFRNLSLILIIASCYLCLIKLDDSYFISFPTHNQALEDQLQDMNKELSEVIHIDKTDKWHNTLLWVLSDIDGSYPWQTLYGLPAGMGINICTYDYIIGNFANLNSGYVACTLNGEVSVNCKNNGWTAIFVREDSNLCIYKKD